MASESLYKYELIKRIWCGQLRRNSKQRIGEEYFNNFISYHRDFHFYIVRIYDGTSHLMLDEEQYQEVKKGLLGKTSVFLNEITSRMSLGGSGNVLERRKTFSTQRDFNKELRELKENEKVVYRRASQKASEHKAELHKLLSNDRNLKFLSYDLEVHDEDFTTILEIGYVKFTLKEGDKPEYFHAIVNEDLHNREGFDNRDKFRFGTTAHMSLREAAVHLQRGVAGSDALVTHSGYHDEQYLSNNNISIAEKTMFDTQTLALSTLPAQVPPLICWGLKKMLGGLHIAVDERILHNAGNDAHYTMLAFKALVKRAMPGTHF